MDRRIAIKSSVLALLGLSYTSVVSSAPLNLSYKNNQSKDIPPHFPNIDPEIISEVVGKSHFDLERVKELVENRPELSRSVWEWRFGDFESAIGAASHVGRRDIASYLIYKGARPTLFTYAMFGEYEVVKSIINSFPNIQRNKGPHGISLLDHAYAGERMKGVMTFLEREKLAKTIEYLESLKDASGDKCINMSVAEKNKYLGNYKYGEGNEEGFTIGLNMREIITLGPIGGFGGALCKIDKNKFGYQGAPSVSIIFEERDDIIISLTLTEPELTIKAKKVS